MAGICVLYLIMELQAFPRRFGVGGLVLYGGALIWFCADYFRFWFSEAGMDVETRRAGYYDVNLELVAKASVFHMFFMFSATIGLLLPWGKWLQRVISATPQPANPSTLLNLITFMFIFGMLPFFLFTEDPWYESIWRGMTGMRIEGAGPRWTVGRTGLLNFNWGGYVGQWLWVGRFAAVLAGFYAIFMTRNKGVQLFCWSMWLIGLALAFGTGTRGWVAFVAMPILGMLYIKWELDIQTSGRGSRPQAFMKLMMVAVVLLSLVQFQGWFRRVSIQDIDTVDLGRITNVVGNDMFSASLFVFEYVPDHFEYFISGRYPAVPTEIKKWVLPIPQTASNFFIQIIPRALWPNKPVSNMWETVNKSWVGTGATASESYRGTTKSTGIVGGWYGTYGISGVLQGGLLFGWLLAVFDRTLHSVKRKPLIIMIVLSLHVFMFRCFRGWAWNSSYPIVISLALLWMLSFFAVKARNEE